MVLEQVGLKEKVDCVEVTEKDRISEISVPTADLGKQVQTKSELGLKEEVTSIAADAKIYKIPKVP